jgi:phospholipid/cholesterol/gamma-HCH transport system substrate-binding protein
VSKELKVGILAIVGIAIFVVGFKFLKGSNVFKNDNTYYAIYDNVDGLNSSNPVYVSGYQVGRIADIDLIQLGNGMNKALVTYSISDDVKIPRGSSALIYATDLLGAKAVKISYVTNSSYYEDEDTIINGMELGMIEKLGTSITPLLGHLDSLVVGLGSVVDKNNKDNLQNTIANINAVITQLNKDLPGITGGVNTLVNDKNSSLNKTLGNLETFTGNLNQNNAKINHLLTNLDQFSDTLNELQLKQTVANAELAIAQLNTLLAQINTGKGTMGKLVKDEALYNNLQNASSNLNLLLDDFKANPNRYVHLSLLKIDRTVKTKKLQQDIEKANAPK